MLNRPEVRNAQNRGMLVELNDAFLKAEADDEIRVVILGGTGSMFSSGHDMGSQVSVEEMATHQSWQENGGTRERSEEHTSEIQSLMRTSYAVFCLKKKQSTNKTATTYATTLLIK